MIGLGVRAWLFFGKVEGWVGAKGLTSAQLLHILYTTSAQPLHNLCAMSAQLLHNYYTTSEQFLHNFCKISAQLLQTTYCTISEHPTQLLHNFGQLLHNFCKISAQLLHNVFKTSEKLLNILHNLWTTYEQLLRNFYTAFVIRNVTYFSIWSFDLKLQSGPSVNLDL